METRSLVVPGVSLTTATRLPAKRLNNVDLPTFGRPTMAITAKGDPGMLVIDVASDAVLSGSITFTDNQIGYNGANVTFRNENNNNISCHFVTKGNDKFLKLSFMFKASRTL